MLGHVNIKFSDPMLYSFNYSDPYALLIEFYDADGGVKHIEFNSSISEFGSDSL